MALQVVGVQLDEARDQVVALEVEPAFRRPALADLGDAAVDHGEPAGLHPVGQHQGGVLEDPVLHGRALRQHVSGRRR